MYFSENIYMAAEKKYKSVRSFYPYYLSEHANVKNRTLPSAGTAALLIILIIAVALQKWWMLLLITICGYGFAWAGYFFIEKMSPAIFTYPLYSLVSDFVLCCHILTGQINQKLAAAKKNIN